METAGSAVSSLSFAQMRRWVEFQCIMLSENIFGFAYLHAFSSLPSFEEHQKTVPVLAYYILNALLPMFFQDGSVFDETGSYNEWWTIENEESFFRAERCLLQQYSKSVNSDLQQAVCDETETAQNSHLYQMFNEDLSDLYRVNIPFYNFPEYEKAVASCREPEASVLAKIQYCWIWNPY
ncbi:hypothetical protein IscW_ISCW003765 [Ixodes scapularis]|uniref:Peptidase M13 C-terminal domain-containing protein n=1 Tax=Ixodes scapularis TaxID=6945 RepID=B7PFF4_IXOSC|nr:hypothetical protein IscW_ISCW003765 [Ixodes scapularis]|eukprot:XP_002433926.1 hypothetical protein IscW_ISCW003765 [Ixodes scapularis]